MSEKLSWDLLLVLFSKTKQKTQLSSKCLKKICIEHIVNSADSKANMPSTEVCLVNLSFWNRKIWKTFFRITCSALILLTHRSLSTLNKTKIGLELTVFLLGIFEDRTEKNPYTNH